MRPDRRPSLRLAWLLSAALLLAVLVLSGRAAAQLGAYGREVWPIALGLVAADAAYLLGLARLWRAAGRGVGVSLLRAGAYLLGVTVLFVALVSPLEVLAGRFFSAHMFQHLLLVLVAAPLLVAGAPVYALLWALPLNSRKALARGWQGLRARRGLRWLAHPLAAWLLFVLTFWGWHIPGLYEAAVRSPAVHALEHLSMLVTAALYWEALVQPLGRRRLSRGAGVLYLFATALQGSLLGALLTFAPRPLYPEYARLLLAMGYDPLADQQLAGLIMWVPSGVVYLVWAGVMFTLWLQDSERAASAVS